MIKIVLDKTQKCYVTSDTHYSHKNIVKGETAWDLERAANSVRDYETRTDMNSDMVNNINSMVKPDDWLLHLGDWSFGGIEQIWEFRKRLNVKNILLVRGNHDHHIHPTSKPIYIDNSDIEIAERLGIPVDRTDHKHIAYVMTQDLFTYVTVNPWVKVIYPNMSFNFDLFHRPMVTWEKISKGWMHLYGHVHSSPHFTSQFPGKCMDVGVDGNYMKPYDLMDVVKELQRKPIDSFFSDDYHLKTV